MENGANIKLVYAIDLIAVALSYLVRICVACKYTVVELNNYLRKILLPVLLILSLLSLVFFLKDVISVSNLIVSCLLEILYIGACVIQYRRLILNLIVQYK